MGNFLPPRIHVLTKPTGAICNLDCSYCFFLEKEQLYPGSNFRMTDEVLETYIRQSNLSGARQQQEAPITYQPQTALLLSTMTGLSGQKSL